MQDGLNAANGLLAEDGDGVLFVSYQNRPWHHRAASASYNTYQNINATMLSKRGLFQCLSGSESDSFWLILKAQNRCEGAVNDDLVVIDTGVESTANTLTEISEVCKETISGLLAAFVVFDVNDDVAQRSLFLLLQAPKRGRPSTVLAKRSSRQQIQTPLSRTLWWKSRDLLPRRWVPA